MIRRLNNPGRIAVASVASALCLTATVVVATTAVKSIAGADAGDQCANTAAATLGWGEPDRADDFTDPSSLDNWRLYDSVGHDGNGVRTPDAISVADGALTITGDAQGNTGGMAWFPGRQYGRWEACVKSPPASEGYHSVVLLWPDAEDWPVGGEVDFMEAKDPARQSVEGWLHWDEKHHTLRNEVFLDATQWHSWAVEWTPEHVAAYVDGRMWWESTDPSQVPPRPMHLCIQLDNMGGDISRGGQMDVDWVREYST